MAYTDLDKQINLGSSTWGIWWDTDPYRFPLSDKLIAFNVAPYDNDWVQSNQKWAVALDWAYHSVCNSLNTNYIESVYQWTWDLSIHSKTYWYTSNINTLLNWRIKWGLYLNDSAYPQEYTSFPEIEWPKTIVKLDTVNKRLSQAVSYDDTIFSDTGKWYIIEPVTWTYFLIVQEWNDIVSYSCDSNWKILNTTAVDRYTPTLPNSTMSLSQWNGTWMTDTSWLLLAANNWTNIFYASFNYTVEWENVVASAPHLFRNELKIWWWILSINNTWMLSLKNENTNIYIYTIDRHVFTANWAWSYQTYPWIQGYSAWWVLNNNKYIWIWLWKWFDRMVSSYVYMMEMSIFEIDLLNTTTITINSLYNYEWGSWQYWWWWDYIEFNTNNKFILSYDWTNIYYLRDTLNIWNAVTNVDTTFDTLWQWQDWLYINQNSLNDLYNSNNFIGISNVTNKLNILWTDVDWWTIYWTLMKILNTSLSANLSENDSFVWLKTETTSQVNYITQEDITVNLNLNWTLLDSKTLTLFPAQTGNRLDTTWPTITYNHFFEFINIQRSNINSPYFDFELQISNPNSRDIKVWFGLIWWDYTSPTWTNDASWDVTAGWDVGVNGSFVELELVAE